MELPTIDGHFWIVRDGKIIDWEFDNYKIIRMVHNCNEEKDYLPAPDMTQKIMIAMFNKVITNTFNKPWDEALKKFYEISLKINRTKPECNRCYQNCLMEIYENGGELVFGSLGFKKKNSNDYWYEYGGKEYKTVKDFIK
jgi:hypothetical protein